MDGIIHIFNQKNDLKETKEIVEFIADSKSNTICRKICDIKKESRSKVSNYCVAIAVGVDYFLLNKEPIATAAWLGFGANAFSYCGCP